MRLRYFLSLPNLKCFSAWVAGYDTEIFDRYPFRNKPTRKLRLDISYNINIMYIIFCSLS